MRDFLALAGLVSLVAATPGAAQDRPKPRNNPGEWIVTDDYPPAALRTRAEGTLSIKLEVDDNGHPTKCEITSSSDVPELDDVACARVLERARFMPATDKRGRPISGIYSATVRFQMPDGRESLPNDGAAVLTFTVEKDGTVTGCSVRGINSLLSRAMCSEAPLFEVPRDDAGTPVRRQVVIKTNITITDLSE